VVLIASLIYIYLLRTSAALQAKKNTNAYRDEMWRILWRHDTPCVEGVQPMSQTIREVKPYTALCQCADMLLQRCLWQWLTSIKMRWTLPDVWLYWTPPLDWIHTGFGRQT